MSKLVPNENKLNDAVRRQGFTPQKLSVGRQKLRVPTTTRLGGSPTQPRFAAKPGDRPRSGEQTRPKSANKMKEDTMATKQAHTVVSRLTRAERPTPKKPSVIPKRITSEMGNRKPTRPMTAAEQRVPTRTLYTNRAARLPNQEVINKNEDLELRQSELIQDEAANGLNDKDSICSLKRNENKKLTDLEVTWQSNIVEFEKMKNELNERQKDILELYAGMGLTHKKMLALGRETTLPSRDELQIMNVTNMTPEQLLQLCAIPQCDDSLPLSPASIDKLYHMPSHLVSSCEQALRKNKEIIDMIESSTSATDKMRFLSKKIKEYAAENEMLSCTFEKAKSEFIIKFTEIVCLVKKSVNETISSNLRIEQLICTNSDLNAQKENLRKQLQDAECCRTSGIKNKLAELEKQLKEEKCKNNLLRDRLTRTTCQSKITSEQVSHMEAALEQARSNSWALERTVLELQEENQKLHKDYSLEFNKFTESIRENTAHLEEIADAREKLQAEKEDLEKRLTELQTHYNESIKNMKKELSVKVEKIIDTEMKFEKEKEERLELVDKVELLCSQLLESELRYKEICKQLQEKELQLSKAAEVRQELDVTKQQLDTANAEIEKYRDRFVQQSEAIKEIERNFKESANIEETLKNNIKIKDEYIHEIEKKVDLLEQQLQERESKMTSYEEQLSSLKSHLSQLQEDYGQFDNLDELYELINQQRANLIDATKQNGELAEAIQKKELETVQQIETLSEQEHMIEERDDIIKMLSQKEEEHTNIIKLLRTNLEMRTQAEVDLNQQLSEKNAEIDTLLNNLDTRKKQICELEKIIYTLENQTRKVSTQKRKAQEKVESLEKKLTEYETIYMANKVNIETPTENLDSIIKILEDELIGSNEPNSEHVEPLYCDHKYFAVDHILRKPVQKHQMDQVSKKTDISVIDDKIQTKSLVENEKYVKAYGDLTCDLDRQNGITNIQKLSIPSTELHVDDIDKAVQNESLNAKVHYTRNLHYWAPAHHRDDKKYKTFKFAAHKL